MTLRAAVRKEQIPLADGAAAGGYDRDREPGSCGGGDCEGATERGGCGRAGQRDGLVGFIYRERGAAIGGAAESGVAGVVVSDRVWSGRCGNRRRDAEV